MRRLLLSGPLFFLCTLAVTAEPTIWYDQPAAEWVEALPVGNGKLGGMVFGRLEKERIQLNEESVSFS